MASTLALRLLVGGEIDDGFVLGFDPFGAGFALAEVDAVCDASLHALAVPEGAAAGAEGAVVEEAGDLGGTGALGGFGEGEADGFGLGGVDDKAFGLDAIAEGWGATGEESLAAGGGELGTEAFGGGFGSHCAIEMMMLSMSVPAAVDVSKASVTLTTAMPWRLRSSRRRAKSATLRLKRSRRCTTMTSSLAAVQSASRRWKAGRSVVPPLKPPSL